MRNKLFEIAIWFEHLFGVLADKLGDYEGCYDEDDYDDIFFEDDDRYECGCCMCCGCSCGEDVFYEEEDIELEYSNECCKPEVTE